MLLRLTVNTTRKLLLNTNISSQKLAKCKFSRLATPITNIIPRNNCTFDVHKHSKVNGIFCVRYQSTVDATKETVLNTQPSPPAPQTANALETTNNTVPENVFISEIPDIPAPQIPEIIETIVKLHPNGEPMFSSIGLCGYSPIGAIQYALEWLHIYCDMPWWAAIAFGTVCVRTLLFPLIILTQKNNVMLNNNLAGMRRIQEKITESRQCGNEYEVAKYGHDLTNYMKEKNINPLKTMFIGLSQMPVFVSFFLALRQMANLPVESLSNGGLWWFTDLTANDPYYILPVITCTTVLATLMHGGSLKNVEGILKHVIRAVPFVMFPFLINFPAVILCYWVSTNFFTLLQVSLLKIDRIRKFFDIPEHIKQQEAFPQKRKSFMDELNNSWTNIKISKQLANKKHADSTLFNEAGKGPLKKTFKYNPSKTPKIAVQAASKKS
ncbi:mitochondrial inner membrane protein OXA1L [Colletes gigas]|uniref:mitochondrial inner membrane protein OXA1L n=1 Tax=Colletes gigas TaxID=935657 RepID=UPI001C9B6C78|nr:mitochondrial inner membrane protein OXA1L [Colletes gigas]